MTEQVYKKVGRKYVPIGYSDGWSGFPADGIWVVQTKPGSKSSECILRIGEVESLSPTTDLIVGYRDKIVKYMLNNSPVGMTYMDYVNEMLKEITNQNKEK